MLNSDALFFHPDVKQEDGEKNKKHRRRVRGCGLVFIYLPRSYKAILVFRHVERER